MNSKPLAERIRPQDLESFVGQKHLISKGNVLYEFIEKKIIPSMIFWGPPGVGKTTLASIIAKTSEKPFVAISGISSGVKEIKEIIQKAKFEGNTILFIDEIHRFNKAQQDALLAAVENGYITLIGATTENPSFEVNTALLSRCQIYTLKPIDNEDIKKVIIHALQTDELIKQTAIKEIEFESILRLSDGDARKALNLFEMAALQNAGSTTLTNDMVVAVAQTKTTHYDKSGEMHYDVISAFIKSIRGSDPNAAVYYLARMIEGGEDVRFIARRLLILASEDIGNANPTALVIATSCFQAVNVIGFPESRIILSQTALYLACSPKSNSSYTAISKAQEIVQKTGNLQVPFSLRNAPTKFMKNEGYGKGYKYAHNYENNFADLEFLPDSIQNTVFFNPANNARENEMRQFLKKRWKDKYGY